MDIIIAAILLLIRLAKADLVEELVKNAGYPIEVHHTYTSDGFKLRLHRIPRGVQKLHYEEDGDLNSAESPMKESVILAHGLLACGAQWVVGDTDKALAFMLADAGFDVWIYHARGTTYSRYHKRWGGDSRKYWDFSFHEIGVLDLTAVIDYIHEENDNQPIHYVGHSQGGTSVLVLLSTEVSYNEKLKSVYLNAPAAFLQNMSSAATSMVRYSKTIVEMANGMSLYAFAPGNPVSNIILETFCRNERRQADACNDIIFRIIGNDTGQMDRKTMLPFLQKYVVNRCALKQIQHFAQIVQAAKFQMFDYGHAANRKIYGFDAPTIYNISAITAPVTVFYGDADALVPSDGIQHLISLLPNVRNSFELPWNHLEMVFGVDADVQINDHIIRSIIAETKGNK